jgi:hypothetical protein
LNRFFDDYAADQLIDTQWKQAGLTDATRRKLVIFRDILEQFNEDVPKEPHPREILVNPKWARVQTAARDALDALTGRKTT